MKKANFFHVFIAFSALTFFSSCSAYGPAFIHQRHSYMETPYGEKMKGQVYATGQYGTDATYKAGETSTNGSLGVHFGATTPYYQIAIGVFGFTGEYKNDSTQKFSYSGLGFRLHHNIKIPINERVELQVIGLGYSINSNNGSYENLRYRRSDALDSLATLFDFGHMTVTTGVRYMTENKTLLGFRYTYGTSGFLFFPTNGSHTLTFTGNVGNTTLALNLSFPQKTAFDVSNAVQPTFSIGLTQGLWKNGF